MSPGLCPKDCEYRQTQMADNSFRRFTNTRLIGYVWRHWDQRMFSRFHVVNKAPPPPFPGKFSYSVLQHWCKALQSHYSSTIRGLFGLFVYYSHYSLHYSSFINYRNMKHYNDWAIREQTIGKSTRYCSPIVVLYLTPGYEARVLVVIVTNIEIS